MMSALRWTFVFFSTPVLGVVLVGCCIGATISEFGSFARSTWYQWRMEAHAAAGYYVRMVAWAGGAKWPLKPGGEE